MPETYGVLCCGYGEGEDYRTRSVLWGDPAQGVFGRVPRAIVTAYELQAEVLILSGGRWDGQDVIETCFIAGWLAMRHLEKLSSYIDLSPEDLRMWIRKRLRFCDGALRTKDEIEKAGRQFVLLGVTRPVIVTSPFHLMRVAREIMETWSKDEFKGLPHPLFIPSDDTILGEAKDVIVVEPTYPHHALARALMGASDAQIEQIRQVLAS